jgi:hypothetical protein
MNLRKGSFWLVSHGPGFGSEAEGLERVIKFGLPGTAMPGHEYFSDQQVADLAAYVLGLARGASPGGERIARQARTRASSPWIGGEDGATEGPGPGSLPPLSGAGVRR